MTTLTWADLQVGQDVSVTEDFRGDKVTGYGGAVPFRPGIRYVVRRVATQKALLHNGTDASWVPISFLVSPDGPTPRKLGETPEGMIAIDDPRIQWIWEDAGKVADKHGYCSVYDQLTGELGAPGREKDYRVWTEINGLRVRVQVKARSKKLAEAVVAEKLPMGTGISSSEE